MAHYEDMYFTRMAKYYETQSSNRYSVKGDVNGWVKVPFNEALYGRNYCGDIVCNTSQALVRDAMAVWVKQQLDLGKTTAQIADYLKTFDVWDRYDLDGDGNFNEPDGYIDHMQIVHAGGDEAAGDPNQGTDAIWSHRWYSAMQAGGPGRLPGVNVGDNGGLVSSALVPDNPTGVWLGDYTVQPENGGLGVFAHEYGHDLGLPDLYDTSGNTGGAENSTGVLDPDVLGRQHRRRQPRRHRRRTDRPRRLGAVPARLAQRRRAARARSTRWPRPARSRPTSSARTRRAPSRRRRSSPSCRTRWFR